MASAKKIALTVMISLSSLLARAQVPLSSPAVNGVLAKVDTLGNGRNKEHLSSETMTALEVEAAMLARMGSAFETDSTKVWIDPDNFPAFNFVARDIAQKAGVMVPELFLIPHEHSYAENLRSYDLTVSDSVASEVRLSPQLFQKHGANVVGIIGHEIWHAKHLQDTLKINPNAKDFGCTRAEERACDVGAIKVGYGAWLSRALNNGLVEEKKEIADNVKVTLEAIGARIEGDMVFLKKSPETVLALTKNLNEVGREYALFISEQFKKTTNFQMPMETLIDKAFLWRMEINQANNCHDSILIRNKRFTDIISGGTPSATMPNR